MILDETINDTWTAPDGTVWVQVWRTYNFGLQQLVWVRLKSK